MYYDYFYKCAKLHADVNHFYDGILPYELHLRMTHDVYSEFAHLLDNTKNYYGDERLGHREEAVTLREACGKAAAGYDLIEDARQTYNDVKNLLGQEAADIIFAVTNEKGKSRKERASPKYYQGIRETPGAVFVKLCDRIANVRFGRMMKSNQFDMYKKENAGFMVSLGWGGAGNITPFESSIATMYAPMFLALENLFRD